jgi:phage terminase large subunit-like protein
MNYILEYNDKVQSGEIVACEAIKTVYAHLADRVNNPTDEFHYDEAKGTKVITFIESFMCPSKGKVANKPLVLDLWQKAQLSAIFGFVDNDGYRQYKECFCLIARKNGKSTLASAIALYCLIADKEPGPQIVSAAVNRDQARIVWSESKAMLRKSKMLAKLTNSTISEIRCNVNDGTFKPLASNTNSMDGLNVSCAVMDEVGAWRDGRKVYDLIVDSQVAREQPLNYLITTNNTVREDIFDQVYEEYKEILKDPSINERKLPILYELDSVNEWKDDTCWIKANPGLGTIKKKEVLAEQVEDAIQFPSHQRNMLCKQFNISETDGNSWLSWGELNNDATYDISKVHGKYFIGGVDLSRINDLTVATAMWEYEDRLYVKQMAFTPRDTFEEKCIQDKVPYRQWMERDLIRFSGATNINSDDIIDWFKEIRDIYDIYPYKFMYDPWSSDELIKDGIQEFGDIWEKVQQTYAGLSIPTMRLGEALIKNQINYDNNPLTKWCLSNTIIVHDQMNNLRPDKTFAAKRIDATMSMLFAYKGYIDHIDEYKTYNNY